MGFILRILFSGLIVFVPSEDRTEVTVFLLNINHPHFVSDSTSLDNHKPLLIARAGNCTGDCVTDDVDIAEWIYADQATGAAIDSLESATAGGGAWVLDGSELTLRKGNVNDPDLPELELFEGVRGTTNGNLHVIPATSAEREDFSWLANLKELCPSCGVSDDLFDPEPPAGLVAARFTLRTGKLFTYSVARIGSDVTPVHFKRLDDTGTVAAYSQAVASWVAADIEVEGNSIEIVEEKFNSDPGRSMLLSPDDGKVEIAMINLPALLPPGSPFSGTPTMGKHFEMFYDVADTPPAAATRLVPRAGAAPGAPSYPEVDWHSIHPQETLASDLLTQLRLNIGRTAYEQILCPPSQDPRP